MILEWSVLLLLLTVFAGLVCASLVGVLWSALTLLVKGAPKVSMKGFFVLTVLLGALITGWLYGDLKVAYERTLMLISKPVMKATVFDREGQTLGALTVNPQLDRPAFEVMQDHRGLPLLVDSTPDLAGQLLLLQEDRRTLDAIQNNLKSHPAWQDCLKNRYQAALSVAGRLVRSGVLTGGSGIYQLHLQWGITDGPTHIKGKLIEEIVGMRLCLSTLPVSAVTRKVLDQATFGPGIVGLGMASRVYFSKAPSQLSGHELAFLITLIPNPGRYLDRQSSRILMENAGNLLRLAAERKLIPQKSTAEPKSIRPAGWDRFGAVGYQGGVTRMILKNKLSQQQKNRQSSRCMLERTARELTGKWADLPVRATTIQVFTSWANLQVPLPTTQLGEQTFDGVMDLQGRLLYWNGVPCEPELYLGSLVKPLATAALMQQGRVPLKGVSLQQTPRRGIRNVEPGRRTSLSDAMVHSDNIYFFELCNKFADDRTYQMLQNWLSRAILHTPLSCVGIGQNTNPQASPSDLMGVYAGLISGLKPHGEPTSIVRVMADGQYLITPQDDREPMLDPGVSRSIRDVLSQVAKAKKYPVRLMKSGTFGDSNEIHDRTFVQQAGNWIWLHGKGSFGSFPIQYPEAAVRHHLQTLQRALSKVKP